MNTTEFIEELYKCSTQKELDALKSKITVELDALNSKNTDINPKMKIYIRNNYDKVINRIFIEPNELESGFSQKLMFKRANSLEKHLNVPMGTFFHTWNGLKLERLESFNDQVLEHKKIMKELGNKQYKEQLELFKAKSKQIEKDAW